MQAARIHRTGGPSVLQFEDAPAPVPGPGEYLIEVRVAGVNPVDTKIRAGKFKLYQAKLPAILGRDIAGVVLAHGPGPRRSYLFKPGARVFGLLDYPRGAYARQTLASARELARTPPGLSDTQAGSLGVAALTAWQGLFDHGRLKRGQRVLIHGGAGGVGHFAVQFAKVRGATVIATARKADLKWVRSLGADDVIDYENDRFENRTGNIDLVFDLIAGETLDRSWQTLKEKGGVIVSTLTEPDAAEAKRHRARGVRMVVKANSKQMKTIAELIVEGRVRVCIGEILPLAHAAQAHRLIENSHLRGKLVLQTSARARDQRLNRP